MTLKLDPIARLAQSQTLNKSNEFNMTLKLDPIARLAITNTKQRATNSI